MPRALLLPALLLLAPCPAPAQTNAPPASPRGVFRYDTRGQWFKGNTHLHSTRSDGGMDFPEIARKYAGAGYRFLFRTDHWVASRVEEDPAEYPLLWLDGVELDGSVGNDGYHVVCLGTFTGLERKMGLAAALEAVRAQRGITILAHPFWLGNSLDSAVRGKFDGVEVYNHVCHWLNGKDDGRPWWDAMLYLGAPATLAVASDDAHLKPEHPGWNGGWIVVNAPELTRPAIMDAIRRGNFYASCGPDFLSLEREGNSVVIKTSPVRFVRLATHGGAGKRAGNFEGELVTSARFEVPASWPFAYLEIEDAQGRRAWSNTLFVPEAAAKPAP
jgi:hypothetical protein